MTSTTAAAANDNAAATADNKEEEAGSSTTASLLPQEKDDRENDNNVVKKEDDNDDDELIAQARAHVAEERLLVAARLLRQVKDKDKLSGPIEQDVLQRAVDFEAAIHELTNPPSAEWKQQGQVHGKYDTIIYYKVNETNELTIRLETAIPKGMLMNIISVFNEVELYKTWLPYYTVPFRMGMRENKVLRVQGRFTKLIWSSVDMPPPLAHREVVFEAKPIDDIDANKTIVVRVDSIPDDHELVPPPSTPKTVRIIQDAVLLFHPCPPDHVVLTHRNNKKKKKNKKEEEKDDDEEMLLLSMRTFVDPRVSFVPKSFINFVTRTFFGTLWANILNVAEEIRNGERTQHVEAIANNRQVYDWIEDRADLLVSNLE